MHGVATDPDENFGDGEAGNTVVYVDGNFTNNSQRYDAEYASMEEYTVHLASGALLYVTGYFDNQDGTIHIDNGGSQLYVGEYFTNNDSLYITDGANVTVVDDFTNTNGLVAVYNSATDKDTAASSLNVGGTFSNSAKVTIYSGANVTVAYDFDNINGLVTLYNSATDKDAAATSLDVGGTFTNSSEVTIYSGANVTAKDFNNTNGSVTLYDKDTTLNVGDTFTNSSTVTVHAGTVTANTFKNESGSLTLYNQGTATFVKANSVASTSITVYGGGTFTAQNGDIDGTFTIGSGYSYEDNGITYTVVNGVLQKTGDAADLLTLLSLYSYGDVDIQGGILAISSGYNSGTTSVFNIDDDASFIKEGDATDTMIISNILVNQGTLTVSGGGLNLESLSYAGDVAEENGSLNETIYTTYTGNFVSEGAVIVSGTTSYLKLDGTADDGALDNEALNSLIEEGYATSNSTHTDVTMNQASVLFYDGVGIVLVGEDAQLVVTSNSDMDTSTINNSVYFDDDTLFKFNGHSYDRENAVITIVGDDGEANTAGSISISSTANFLATNLIHDTYYTIIENVDDDAKAALEASGWFGDINNNGSLDHMIEDVEILYVASDTNTYGDSSTNDIVLVTGGVTDTNFGDDEEIFDSMQVLWEEGENDKESDNAGTGFVSDAADKTEIPDVEEAAKTLESATNVAITGGVVQLTTDASDIMSQAVNLRIDGLHADAGGYVEDISATDWGLWAIPLYQQSQVRNIKVGTTTGGYDGWLAGVVAGIDRKKDEWTLGVALGIGIGEMKSTDNFADTETDIDFWSAIAYAGYHKERFEWKADFTYTNASSEIRQENPYHLISMSDIRADVDGQLFSLGTQVSYKIIDDDVDVTPHIGFRYRAYRQGSFNSTIDGRGLFHVESADMDTYLLPVGVLISTDFQYTMWLITPRLDLVYTAFFGDTSINNYVGLTGSGADVDAFGTAKMQSDVLDDYMLSLGIGCGAKKDEWSLGLDLDFQKSENREAQAIFARVAYRF
ncbi:MAG: hypothetical protein R3Y11_05690 [Pseudomonadota bacterium]